MSLHVLHNPLSLKPRRYRSITAPISAALAALGFLLVSEVATTRGPGTCRLRACRSSKGSSLRIYCISGTTLTLGRKSSYLRSPESGHITAVHHGHGEELPCPQLVGNPLPLISHPKPHNPIVALQAESVFISDVPDEVTPTTIPIFVVFQIALVFSKGIVRRPLPTRPGNAIA